MKQSENLESNSMANMQTTDKCTCKHFPLTDKQIEEIAEGYLVDYRIPAGCAWNFARDIEAAHGIKE